MPDYSLRPANDGWLAGDSSYEFIYGFLYYADESADGYLRREPVFQAPDGETALPAGIEYVYIGAAGKALRYLGTRLDADLYLGAKVLWP